MIPKKIVPAEERKGPWHPRPLLRNVPRMQSPDLQNPCGLHHGRFALAFGKFRGLDPVGIDAGKPLAILIKNGDLPVPVLAAFIFAELGMFTCSFRFCHNLYYLNGTRRAQVPMRVLCCHKSRSYILFYKTIASLTHYQKLISASRTVSALHLDACAGHAYLSQEQFQDRYASPDQGFPRGSKIPPCIGTGIDSRQSSNDTHHKFGMFLPTPTASNC